MAVTLEDFSANVLAHMRSAVSRGLYEAGAEVAAHANTHIQSQWEARDALRGSYRHVVNEGAGEVTIGTAREEGYWEEFGTGSYADTSRNGGHAGRPMWWVFVPYETPRALTHQILRTQEEAEAEAASRQAQGENAIATNGQRPSYTLENAFTATRPGIITQFERLLREELS